MARSTVYNRIFNDEDWAKVNPKNKQLLKQWQTYLSSTNKSKATIYQYTNDIKIIYLFLLRECDNRFIVDLNKRDIIAFQGYSINEWGHSSNRTRRIKSCLSSLCNFVENIMDDLYPDFRNIVNKIESPINQPVREKTILSEEQVETVLKTLVDSKQYQKACVFALAANSGARLSELVRFEVNFFDEKNLQNNSYYKTPKRIKTKGRGSQGKLMHKYVLKAGFQEYLDLWLEERKELGIENEELFVTRRDGEWVPATNTTLQSWKTQFSKILGESFYFHSLRHFLTSRLRKNRIPDRIIKDFFGWESIDMIETYDDNESEDDFANFFTEDGIKTVENKNLTDI